MNKKLVVIALIIVLASVGFVAADEAGVITININNNSKGQVNLNVSNSTIQGQTNYTVSQANENITLNNSTLTLNVNGQNITISSQGNSLVVTTQNQTVALNPNPQPLLSVSFLGSQPTTTNSIVSGNGTIEYDFNVTVNVPTSMNYPFGVNVTHSELSRALLPLVDKYNLVVNNYNGNGNITSALWVDMPIVDGMNTFSLFSYQQLNAAQTESLTNDLFNAFTLAMNGSA
jgi:hypothetical protein